MAAPMLPPPVALVVFARPPIAGHVKTRLYRAAPDIQHAALGRTLDAEHAALLHHAFVADVLENSARVPFSTRLLYVAGDPADPALSALAQTHGYTMRAQAGSDLGSRMRRAIADELAAGSAAVVLIGTDSPTLPAAYLHRALRHLQAGVDFVLGPAHDGGYYLIAARADHPSLFPTDMPWGTPAVLPRTLSALVQLSALGHRCHLLPFHYDCDTPADLRLLSDHLRLAMHAQAPSARAAPDDDVIDAPHTAKLLSYLGILGGIRHSRDGVS